MSTAVWIHALWMLAAVAVGTWSGYLGLIRATTKGGKSFLPGRYTLRVHRWTGTVYYAMLCVGIIYGFLMAEYILGIEPAVIAEKLEYDVRGLQKTFAGDGAPVHALRGLDLDNLTPRQALDLLTQWKEKHK